MLEMQIFSNDKNTGVYIKNPLQQHLQQQVQQSKASHLLSDHQKLAAFRAKKEAEKHAKKEAEKKRLAAHFPLLFQKEAKELRSKSTVMMKKSDTPMKRKKNSNISTIEATFIENNKSNDDYMIKQRIF